MIRLVLRGLAARKLRSALTSIAIILGVAMVAGTFIFTDQIDRAFRGVGVETLVEPRRQPAGDHRGARKRVLPGDRPALRVEPS